MTIADLNQGSSWFHRLLLMVGLSPSCLNVIVAVDDDGRHSIVELYTSRRAMDDRKKELIDSGFAGRRISTASRFVLQEPSDDRHYGPAWKRSVGWTPGATR